MGRVVSVSLSRGHTFSKTPEPSITLIAGHGIEGDVHAGPTMQHGPKGEAEPNLRQVHLLHAELFADVEKNGYRVTPGDIGENITTEGIDLLALPHKARLHVGDTAVLEITGVRAPCRQIDKFRKGLMKEMLEKRPDGSVLRKTGVMSIVIADGVVTPGDAIRVDLPAEPFEELPVL